VVDDYNHYQKSAVTACAASEAWVVHSLNGDFLQIDGDYSEATYPIRLSCSDDGNADAAMDLMLNNRIHLESVVTLAPN
jgi:hypothetical protein